jgi:hypothetical protein
MPSAAAAVHPAAAVLQGLLERFQKKGGGFLGIDLSSIFGNK